MCFSLVLSAPSGQQNALTISFRYSPLFFLHVTGKQAPLEVRSNTGDTPLTLASYFGHVHAVEKLLAMGADAMAVDDDGHAAGEQRAGLFSGFVCGAFDVCVLTAYLRAPG